MALPIVIPVGTALVSVFSYLFRFAAVQFVAKFAIFALVALGGYFITATLLPDWFSLETLRASITEFSPPIAYFLYIMGFYEGAPLIMTALVSAWVLKKVPAWVWWGPLYRFVNK